MMGKIVILVGTPSRKSRLNGFVQLAAEQLAAAGWQVDWVYVSELPPEDLIYANFASESIKQATALVEAADAVVVASPVYKASYSGILKTFLDLLPQQGLVDKIVLPLFIGGTIAHLLTIDYALKPVLNALGARFILGGVYAVDSQVQWNEQGGVDLAEELHERLTTAVRAFAGEVRYRIERKAADVR